MNEDLRWAIEVSKEKYSSYEPQYVEDLMKAEQLLITTAEQVLEAGENLPYQNTGNPARDSEHNSVVDECLPILAKYKMRIAKLRAVLEELAKLGNGDRYGNSDGNVIAQEVLKEDK
jgi:hypothetical protein